MPEYLVSGVVSLSEGRKTAVSVEGELTDSFYVKVSVHQGSVLSTLLFVILIDALPEYARDGSLMELLYAHDLTLCGDSLDKVMAK